MSKTDDAKEPYWLKARSHFRSAVKVLSRGGEEAPRYAALSLRMALECLSYSYLQALRLDLDPKRMRVWQAGKVVKLLKEIDPNIGVSREIKFSKSAGESQTAVQQLFCGQDIRLPARRIDKLYNKLGRLLHEASPEDIRKNRVVSEEQAMKDVRNIVAELEDVLSSSERHIHVRAVDRAHCECGFLMSRSSDLLRVERQMHCADCEAVYVMVDVEKGILQRQELKFSCESCGRETHVPGKIQREGDAFVCSFDDCGAVSRLAWRLVPVLDA